MKEITEKNEGGNEVKKKRNVITATLLGILLLIIVMFLILGRKECEWCGNIYYGASYYDPYDEEDIMCEECAKEYFCGLPYEGYRVR